MKLIDITVTHSFPAQVENVFDVWMDPKSPGGPWFGADRVILNPVVDGLFYFSRDARRTKMAALWALPSDRTPSPNGVHLDV